MPPRLAQIYPPPRTKTAPPPIFTPRTVALPAAVTLGALACWAVDAPDFAVMLAAVATVWAMQLIAPAVRRRSLSMAGWASEVLFAAPFVLFFLPYVAWTAIVRPAFAWDWAGAVLAVVVAAAVYASDWRRLRLGFDRELLELMAPLRLSTAALRSYQLLAAAIGQELFYRGVLFAFLVPVVGWWAVPVSTVLFVVEHLGNRWAGTVINVAYVVRITVLSTLLASIAYVTGSLWAAVLGHVTYNLFPVAQIVWHYRTNPYRGGAG
ncbi:CPBP family intramembrane glutamic endopeptidase [Nonomuraea fastidiosa]|uniref:CPBP family intramembrane glutamic endopeptidase n=1 Tax=Nonomuraea TaxID=83681 RepID=UPI0032551C92